MKWKWKQGLASLLAASLVFTMSGEPAFAVGTEAAAVHTALCEHHPEHTEDCGYTEGAEGSPCTYVCELCETPDSGEAPAECSCEKHCREDAVDADCPLCRTLETDFDSCKGKAAEENAALEVADKNLAENLDGAVPAEPDEKPAAGLSLKEEGVSVMAAGETITISGNVVSANGIPIVIRENGSITSIYDTDGALLSGATDVTDKWICGGWNDSDTHRGSTSVTMESGTITKNIYGGSIGGTLEGNTNVVIKGGKAGWVYGGGEGSSVNGTANVTIHPGSKIWGACASADEADAGSRGTVFGGGLDGTVEKTVVTLLGGDYGWAYGGGQSCTVGSANLKLLGNPENWCSVFGGGNGGSIEKANLTARGINGSWAVYMYGGGWDDEVGEANITIGGDCRFAGNVGIYGTGSGEAGSGNTSAVDKVNFVIDNFDLISEGNTTVCGPFVGTNVTGGSSVLVTGTKNSDTSMQLFLKDIDEVILERCSVVLFGADPADAGNPSQPLELERLEVRSSGKAVFTGGNTSVTIGELAGSGQLHFQTYSVQPAVITGVHTVSSTIAAPLQITETGVEPLADAVFISGTGITSAEGFLSGMPGYTAVRTSAGIQLKPSSEAKMPVDITLAVFDKDSYAYGEDMTLAIEAIMTGGAPLAGETVYIWAGDAGVQVASAVLDSEGRAVIELPVNSFLRDIFRDSGLKRLIAMYKGSKQYETDFCVLTCSGTDKQTVTLTDTDIALTQEIPAPALNVTPLKELETGDSFFTAEVVWSPDTTVFEEDIAYSAGIILKPKQGYDFDSVGTITWHGTAIIPQEQSDGSLLLPAVKTFAAIPPTNMDYGVRRAPLDTVPAELQSRFSSIEELKEAIYREAALQLDIPEENMVHYEVELLVSLDGGGNWQKATPGNFPSEGIEVTLPYPDGTKGDTHDFVVAHMLTRAMNGNTPGEIEFPAVRETSYGLSFRVYSLSPVAVGWKQVKSGSDSSSDDSSSSDYDSSSSGGITAAEQPVQSKLDIPAIGGLKAAVPDADGNVIVGREAVQSGIETARNDMKKNGNIANGVAVRIPVTLREEQTSFRVTIKAQAMDTLVEERVKWLEIDMEGALAERIDADGLKWLDSISAGGDIILCGKRLAVSDLSEEAQAAIGGRPVYELSLAYLSDGGEIPVTDLQGHTFTLYLPYTPLATEQSGSLYAVYVDNAGRTEWLANSSYDLNLDAVVFETTHFSIFGVGCRSIESVDTDLAGHWAKDDMVFAISRGLLSGMGNSQSAPDTGITRGMLAAALGRLDGIDPAQYQAARFSDVPADSYYAPYVSWAVEKGIMTGTAADTFSPDSSITREQMAVIIANYAKAVGKSLPAVREATAFADKEQISGEAWTAVKTMQQAGILDGKNGNLFDPKGTATRAEAAAALRHFVEITMDAQTAQGWAQNHSGSWQFWKNGRLATGWLCDDGKWYWLDANGCMSASNWLYDDGRWYRLNADGSMLASNWLYDDNKWYWLDTNGSMLVSDWKQIGGKWYYFNADGAMASSTTIEGRTLGADGAEVSRTEN